MKPSDIASNIANRNQRDAQSKPSHNPDHQAQIDQAWEARHPAPAVEG